MLNSRTHYGAVQRVLHWGMAVLIIGQIILGWTFPQLEKGSAARALCFYWHVILASLILILVIFRLVWRLSNPSVQPIRISIIGFSISSAWMHGLLYLLLFALPISGYFLVTAKWRVLRVAWFSVAPLIHSEVIAAQAHRAHEVLSYMISGAIVLHIAAAWRHVLYKESDI